MDIHQKQRKYFENSISRGVLSHAYLFWGPEMIGKKDFADDLFRLVNKREPASDPDLKIISPRVEEDETKIYIEDMRDLKSFLSYKPYYGPYKFVIINDADRLTLEASNSILKVLEEPAPHSIIILISSRPKLILPTILSRCESVQFLAPRKKKFKEDVRSSMEEFHKVSRQGIFERMEYAKKIYEKESYAELINALIHSADHTHPTHYLRGLLRVHKLISQPQFNHRLALEHFLINL